MTLSRTDVTREQIETGGVLIEVYAMKTDTEGSRLTLRGEVADFYDLTLRPDDWGATEGVPYEEHENLTLPDAERIIAELEAYLPEIAVEWIEG